MTKLSVTKKNKQTTKTKKTKPKIDSISYAAYLATGNV